MTARRIAVAIAVFAAAVISGLAAPAPASAATVTTSDPVQTAQCSWGPGQFANGVRIRARPSFSAPVRGLGYPNHRVRVYDCPVVTDTVWLAVQNQTTGVSGWSQQGLVWGI
jgi:hypothetical protein